MLVRLGRLALTLYQLSELLFKLNMLKHIYPGRIFTFAQPGIPTFMLDQYSTQDKFLIFSNYLEHPVAFFLWKFV